MLKLDSFRVGATQKIKSYDRVTQQRWTRLPSADAQNTRIRDYRQTEGKPALLLKNLM